MIYELTPAFGVALVVTIGVGLLTRPPVARHEMMRAMRGSDAPVEVAPADAEERELPKAVRSHGRPKR